MKCAYRPPKLISPFPLVKIEKSPPPPHTHKEGTRGGVGMEREDKDKKRGEKIKPNGKWENGR